MARFAISCVLLVASAASFGCRPSPEDALRSFYANQVPECMLEEPLWASGREVVPLVLVEVLDREMPRRRYAIGFLGNIGDRRALDVLGRIVDDPSEIYYFRADALKAIAKIDSTVAKGLAEDHVSGEGLLGEYAVFISQGGEFERYGSWARIVNNRCT